MMREIRASSARLVKRCSTTVAAEVNTVPIRLNETKIFSIAKIRLE